MFNKRSEKRVAAFLMSLMFVLSFGLGAFAWSPDRVIYANADPDMYYVECDVTNQIVTVFEKGESTKKDKVLRQMICTTGASATKTPLGVFQFNDTRRRFGYFSKFDCYAQYWIQVNGGIYFHSVLYPKPVEGTFTRSSYNQLGSPGSHGCIRMLVEDVRWMYYNVPAGTKGAIVANAKDENLRKSLLPKQSHSQYKPKPDRYEMTGRDHPKAILSKNAEIKYRDGSIKTLGAKSVVSVLSSGLQACRVTVEGKDGLVSTSALTFVPNGYEDVNRVYRAKADLDVYEAADAKSEVIATVENAQELNVVKHADGFFAIDLDGETGYVEEADVGTYIQILKEKAIWVKAPVKEPELVDESIADDDLVPDEDIEEEPVN